MDQRIGSTRRQMGKQKGGQTDARRGWTGPTYKDHGQTNCETNGRTYTHKLTCGPIHSWMDGWMDGWMDASFDSCDRCLDSSIDWHTERRIHKYMGGRTGRQREGCGQIAQVHANASASGKLLIDVPVSSMQRSWYLTWHVGSSDIGVGPGFPDTWLIQRQLKSAKSLYSTGGKTSG